MLKAVVSKQGYSTLKVNVLFRRKLSIRTPASQRIGIGGFALLTVPIGTFCLGTWQVERRKWKLNLIEQVKSKIKSPPVELPDLLEHLSDMEYQPVRVKGTFDHSKEMYIGPRGLITDKEENSGGIMSAPAKSGNLVITPFHLADRDLTILVNRGWVPRNKTDPLKRVEGQVTEEIELVGAVRLHENRPQFSPKTKADSNLFYFRDVNSMAAMSGAAPVFIDSAASTTVPGGPIGGQTRISFRNEHLSYIFTWYSLSAATFYMWYKMYFRSLKFL